MTGSTKLEHIIAESFANRQNLQASRLPSDLKTAIATTIDGLNSGQLRAASRSDQGWQVNTWVKQAILLYFATNSNAVISAAPSNYFDKVPLKYSEQDADTFQNAQTRVVPGALVRTGCYVGKNTVLMPSFINIGAYVDDGCMIDTWATVGSCAQVGKNVHISGGAGIGGVLEPLQATPTIIEDNCFIGARSEIVEGVIVEQGAVIAMGVFISQSTPIYDRERDEISYGRVPAGSVVIAGSIPGHNNKYQKQAAIIVKKVDAKTRAKVSVNEILREEV